MKRVLLLLCKGFEAYEAAAFIDVLGWSGIYGNEAIEVVKVGLSHQVRGTFGVHIMADRLLTDIVPGEFDALAIPGGFETEGFYSEAYSESVSALIRNFNAQAKPIAAICVGALPLGKSGILSGREATTYHLREGLRRRQLAVFGAKVIDQPIVRDQNVITSSAPVTAAEVAFALLSDLTGSENAISIRRMMGF